MIDTLVLTAIGPDRTGLVEALARTISEAGGNWEESRMVRLAGQFAGVLRVTIDRDRTDRLVAALRGLESGGLHVSARVSESGAGAAGTVAILVVTGTDRPGIVHGMSGVLARCGVNVEELASQVESAPMSGEPLFTARARLLVPAGFDLVELRIGLEALGPELMVDLSVDGG